MKLLFAAAAVAVLSSAAPGVFASPDDFPLKASDTCVADLKAIYSKPEFQSAAKQAWDTESLTKACTAVNGKMVTGPKTYMACRTSTGRAWSADLSQFTTCVPKTCNHDDALKILLRMAYDTLEQNLEKKLQTEFGMGAEKCEMKWDDPESKKSLRGYSIIE